MKSANVIATGSYLPEKVLLNTDLESRIDTTDEWIVQRTGIKQRHIAASDESSATMGAIAAQRALQAAGLEASAIDLIIVATCTPPQIFPSTACQIQETLKIPSCAAFDVQAACSGFIYALNTASLFLQQGQAMRALVIGTETMSRVVDWEDRATCVLFGDGAGAVILEASDQQNTGLLSARLCADGRYRDLLYLNNAHTSEDAHLHMEGSAVFKQAVRWLGEVANQIIDDNHLQAEDIDWIIPHQANIRIIQSTAKKLGIPLDKVVVTVDQHANTSGASIPIALDIAVKDGRVKRGQNLLLEAFGGGLTWGACLIKY